MTDEDWTDQAIDRWMRERRVPTTPSGFTAAVMSRVGQERWRVERYWDLGFNLAMAAGLTLVVTGVLGLIYMSGLAVVGREAVLLFAQALATTADQLAPAVPAYAGSFALTVTALSLWWYVEN